MSNERIDSESMADRAASFPPELLGRGHRITGRHSQDRVKCPHCRPYRVTRTHNNDHSQENA